MTRAPRCPTPLAALGLLAAAPAGCSDDAAYIVVTVETRPAVRDPAALRVTLSNAGSMRTEDLALRDATFPATFSISPEGRTGELGIAIDAVDEEGLVVGRGAAQGPIDAATARVVLDPTDFVVNTEYAEDQELSNYFGANGFQLAAGAAGTWTAVYTGTCRTPCHVFARRFDAAGRPVRSAIAAGTQGFPVSTKLTTSFSTPAVASNGTTAIALWNADDPAASAYSIECRALDASGAGASSQVQIATDEFPNLVSAAPLPNGNFAVTWDGRATTSMIRSAIVRPDCTPLAPAVQVSAAGGLPGRSHVTASATGVLHTWVLDGGVHVRAARLDGSFLSADLALVPRTATETVEYARAAPLGAGFALVVRWALATGTTGPGRLELYRVSAAGALLSPTPVLVSDRSGTDSDSSESFGLAPRADGSLLVVWHACMDRGDGSGCGVFGRLVGADGTPAGPEVALATTTANDQTGPSAVALPDGAVAAAWTDRSSAAPDSSGAAVRARILYLSPASSSAR